MAGPTDAQLRQNERLYRCIKRQLSPAEKADLFEQGRRSYQAYSQLLRGLAEKYLGKLPRLES